VTPGETLSLAAFPDVVVRVSDLVLVASGS
jgi:hypothetical protein